MGLEGFGQPLIKGTVITVCVSLCAFIFGMILAILFTLAEFGQLKFLKLIIRSLVAFIRGLPELLVLFAVYFVSSVLWTQLFHRSFQMSAFSFTVGVCALGMIFASYATQTLRSAFLAVPIGQTEAGKALGLSSWIVFKRITLPQAWCYALPGLSNLWLVLLKDSALVAFIGLGDLMNEAELAASTTREPFKFYMTAALLFLTLTFLSQLTLKIYYKKAIRR